MVASRGSSNANQRGSSEDRRKRREWIIGSYQSNVAGMARCYRCGILVYNPDSEPDDDVAQGQPRAALTIDRITPGAMGGTYRRTNIRPACGECNSETGGALSGKGSKHVR